MKRHPALIPLSHDHHHGLVQARRLRRAAERPAAEQRDAAALFLQFFASDTRPHFRDEEEQLFPLLAGAEASATKLVVQALLEHQRLHALVQALESELAGGAAPAAQMQELAEALEGISASRNGRSSRSSRSLRPAALRRLQEASATRAAADLNAREGTGPLWGAETEDLNATLLAWPPGDGPSEHVNEERDVLLVVMAGSATVTVDGEARTIDEGQAMTIEKGSSRRIVAGSEGVRYLSAHTRRPPLQISRAVSSRHDRHDHPLTHRWRELGPMSFSRERGRN